MSFSVGIIGLPNVGKSTLFKALTKKKVAIEPRPFTTIVPNLGKVKVPDNRLEALQKLIKPEKTTPTTIEFVDIAGLVQNAYKGEGLGNQFLAQIRNCNAIVEVVRAFVDEKIEHIMGEINPRKDIEIVQTELLMKDLETVEKSLQKTKEEKKRNLLEKLRDSLSRGIPAKDVINLEKEEKAWLEELHLLTQKPIVFVLNIGENNIKIEEKELPAFIKLNLKLEEEINELSEEERKELGLKSELEKLIIESYKILDLITFFTVAGGKEVRAWTLKRGFSVYEAAGKVHSDFQKRFIRAEVINWKKLVSSGSWTEAKSQGLVQIQGKDYIVQDGDVIEFKI